MTNTDYISRYELLEQLDQALESIKQEAAKADGDELLGQFLAGELDMICACKIAVMSKKAADVRENVHGEWLEREDPNGDPYYICSNCRVEFVTIEGTPMDNGIKYCPFCGSMNPVTRWDMRGE